MPEQSARMQDMFDVHSVCACHLASTSAHPGGGDTNCSVGPPTHIASATSASISISTSTSMSVASLRPLQVWRGKLHQHAALAALAAGIMLVVSAPGVRAKAGCAIYAGGPRVWSYFFCKSC